MALVVMVTSYYPGLMCIKINISSTDVLKHQSYEVLLRKSGSVRMHMQCEPRHC